MNTSDSSVCNYALLRFLPYPETGEFVNIGVVVCCASTGALTSRVEMVNDQRVTDFFPDLDAVAFRQGRAAMVAEIRRMEQLQAASRLGPRLDRERGRDLFLELVRPRESVFRFGEIRTILTPDPETVADQLFERYVERRLSEAPQRDGMSIREASEPDRTTVLAADRCPNS